MFIFCFLLIAFRKFFGFISVVYTLILSFFVKNYSFEIKFFLFCFFKCFAFEIKLLILAFLVPYLTWMYNTGIATKN